MQSLPPIRREILVNADPATAFAVFTDAIGTWWPLVDHSVYGADGAVTFVDGRIIESAPGRPDAIWATVTTWNPPAALALRWHPGCDPARAGLVTVHFRADGPRTRVQLEHSGWEHSADPAAARAEYDEGWPVVLEAYAGHVSAAADDAWTWVALLHRPGAAASLDEGVFDDPRFGEHVAFLDRMRSAGYLVAAGPLLDEPGAGMTILRLPGVDRLADATALASVDDLSVASGFFTVDVRPWHVIMRE